jgi:hypothetical protein
MTGSRFSIKTIARILQPLGIKKWLAKKRPLLTPGKALLRYRFVKRYRNFDWSKVIFSDECSVERGASHMRKWVYRHTGQAYYADMSGLDGILRTRLDTV